MASEKASFATQFAANEGIPLDLNWVNSVQCNYGAVQRNAEAIVSRRALSKNHQTVWMLRAITCIDLTTLAGDDTLTNVTRLCHKAKQPVQEKYLSQLGLTTADIQTGAVCVYPARVADCAAVLKRIEADDTRPHLPIAAVATGFPSGQYALSTRLEEIKMLVNDGATEIDIVINRALALKNDWKGLYDEIKAMKKACGKAHMKTILAVGELGTAANVYKCSLVAMMAGSDFIKTSTGKEAVNATLPIGLIMARAIQAYWLKTGFTVDFKPAGGIRTASQAIQWLTLMQETLGPLWTHNDLFRIGASGLLTDIEKELHFNLAGTYATDDLFPMA
ncbi:Deoxyribose-phosphate aldolase [Hypsibius exemplaris]|uniref:deoxyribose-phosphate aldolase n=1 Tax=Hypsibius exemplaris TaxID=2072580 RepID=A0A1W0WYE1_HYPEX|nr:Deoxyribose-phosphate aldolase [Hypsibius exemplaris]